MVKGIEIFLERIQNEQLSLSQIVLSIEKQKAIEILGKIYQTSVYIGD